MRPLAGTLIQHVFGASGGPAAAALTRRRTAPERAALLAALATHDSAR